LRRMMGAMCWNQWHKAPFLPATFPEQEAMLARVFQARWQCVMKIVKVRHILHKGGGDRDLDPTLTSVSGYRVV